MIAWMLYSVAVALCAVVAARAVESLFRMRGIPIRFVWIGAAMLSLILATSAPVRARVAHNGAAPGVDLSSFALVRTGIRSVEAHVPSSIARYAVGLWVLASVLFTTVFVAAYWRARRQRLAWPVVDLCGQRVRLAPLTGPIVIGLVRPEIILPRWILTRSSAEQQLIVDHEAAHVRARDPIVLAACCAAVGLMPWNPAFWIILARIRLAIEVDCDARLLHAGVSPRSYGALLVDVAERASPLPFAATALADGTSHLHQRILAMEPRRFTHPLLRGVTTALLSLAALLAACEAKVPTAADIQQMDGRSAERSAQLLGMVVPDSALVWSIDGVPSTEAAAKAIRAESIAAVQVGKSEGRAHIYVTTKAALKGGYATVPDSVRVVNRRVGLPDDTVTFVQKLQTAAMKQAAPIVLIDGVRSDAAALRAIDRKRIDRVEVLKGPLAVGVYGADATNGVIVVTTKAAGTQ
jgi:TonB-dependent SusC/RagA subfamily outer membrane receptor